MAYNKFFSDFIYIAFCHALCADKAVVPFTVEYKEIAFGTVSALAFTYFDGVVFFMIDSFELQYIVFVGFVYGKRQRPVLRRLIGAIYIPFNDIIELKTIPNSETLYSIRLFGSGGMFGYLGKFRNPKLGRYTMYATNLNELILVRTNRKSYVFSCKNCDKFIESFNSLLGNQV